MLFYIKVVFRTILVTRRTSLSFATLNSRLNKVYVCMLYSCINPFHLSPTKDLSRQLEFSLSRDRKDGKDTLRTYQGMKKPGALVNMLELHYRGRTA